MGQKKSRVAENQREGRLRSYVSLIRKEAATVPIRLEAHLWIPKSRLPCFFHRLPMAPAEARSVLCVSLKGTIWIASTVGQDVGWHSLDVPMKCLADVDFPGNPEGIPEGEEYWPPTCQIPRMSTKRSYVTWERSKHERWIWATGGGHTIYLSLNETGMSIYMDVNLAIFIFFPFHVGYRPRVVSCFGTLD